MKCVKCGADLRSEQKVCIVCGTRTAAGGYYHVEEKEPWRPSRKMIYAAAGVGLLLIVMIVAHAFRVVPPDEVTREWFGAMTRRSCGKAAGYHSPEFASKMQPGISDTHALSDYFFDETHNSEATYTIGKATYPSTDRANVAITLNYPDNRVSQISVDLEKSGRRWLITGVAH